VSIRTTRPYLGVTAAGVIGLAAVATLTGCATTVRRAESEASARFASSAPADAAARSPRLQVPWTGRVLSAGELRQLRPHAILAEENYAEVNANWLPQYYREFRNELFRLGITRWDERFDCNRFADLFTSLAQAHFFRAAFHSRTPAKALALGPYWYIRADGSGAHAIVQAITQHGPVYLDPQTGEQVKLAPGEKFAAYLQFF
jgi:hypothetical protein